MTFKKWVKNIHAAGYNGARMVFRIMMQPKLYAIDKKIFWRVMLYVNDHLNKLLLTIFFYIVRVSNGKVACR